MYCCIICAFGLVVIGLLVVLHLRLFVYFDDGWFYGVLSVSLVVMATWLIYFLCVNLVILTYFGYVVCWFCLFVFVLYPYCLGFGFPA